MGNMNCEGKVVCVTGGSGFIGSWIVKLLLLRGYVAKATVRDTNDPNETKHLLALDGAKERLELFKTDLLEEGAFDSAVQGCVAVFHTASPVLLYASDPQAQLIDPAVKGTLSVLKSCVKAATVKRVIITSSMGAVLNSGKSWKNEVVDETWYSDPDVCTKLKLWYELSKILAENAAWNFAKENSLDIVMINPIYVIGPLLQPTLNGSVEMFLQFIEDETYPNSYYPTVDVRDVAEAHIKAFEMPSATGRYCLGSNMNHFSEIIKIVHDHFPAMKLPQKSQDGKYPFPDCIISQEKAKSLGINFIPLESTIKDMIDSLKKKGFISF